MIHSYQKKAYKCGNLLEEYEFEKPVFFNFTPFVSNVDKVRIPKERSDFSVSRSKKRIRRLVNSNPGMDKFLTLTFAENVTDIKVANYEFKKFRQKLQRSLGISALKYLGVVEFQKRGAIHYHLMIDMPYIDQDRIQALWGQGRVWIERIRDKNKTGMYLAKYMKKGLFDLRLYGQRAFFYSYKLLLKPIEHLDIFIDAYVALVYRKTKSLIKEYTYYSDIRGRIVYRLYQLTPEKC